MAIAGQGTDEVARVPLAGVGDVGGVEAVG